jgi:pimeloyl-ACP methyl ester carboxylesterase
MTEIKNALFAEQIDGLKEVESFGGQAGYLYFKQEVPREGSLPVLIAGGWSEGTQSLRDTAQVVFEDGREVILVDHARDGGPAADDTDYNPELAHKARTLLNVLDDAGAERVDVIAHSEGSLNVVLAAQTQPERFRNIVLVAPAGMIGKDTQPKLYGRFARKVVRGMLVDMREIKKRDKESAERFAKSGPDYIKSNWRKGLREVGAIATGRIDGQLADLRAAGIGVSVLQSHADKGFPDKRIEKQVRLGENVDAYASVASKRAGHDDLIIHPERTTRAALAMLSQFEKPAQ